MKIKCTPDDFRVEELANPAGLRPDGKGPYTYYKLTKRGVGTLEAIEAIRRRWNLSARQIHYGGLKDRHASTVQYLTIQGGPSQPLQEPNLTLEPMGYLDRPYGPSHFRGNRFVVVLRDLSPAERDRARRSAVEIPRDGLPNYFDDQRFGSLGESDEFMAEAWIKGDHERALWLAIAEPTPSDRPDTRKEKVVLREFWGNWAEAKTRLDRSHARSLVTYLVDHPTDFRGAFARLRRELRSIAFSAFQSHLWNLLLARRIEEVTRPDQRIPVEFRAATLAVFRDLEPDQVAELRRVPLPLPSARTPLPEGPLGELCKEILAARGLTWEQMRVKHLKDLFFSKGDRAPLFFPANFESREADDDLYPRRRKLELSFDLPKGAYATLVVKRLTELA
jgi:tRNA pseudouridine13 synthase